MKTLKDVAAKAGVSIATVSRVLAGDYPVSAQTKQRVLGAVQALHYHPNGIARSLRQSKTNTLGVLIPDIANPYFMQVIRAMEKAVDKLGYHLLIASSNENAKQERDLLRIFLEKRLDGVIMAPNSRQASGELLQLFDGQVPVVFVDRTIDGVSANSVHEEGRKASCELVEYLISQGHERIAIVNHSGTITTATEREAGFQDAMARAGLRIRDTDVVWGDYSQETGYRAGKRFLKMVDGSPTAVFCTNNLIALGLLQAVYEAGKTVPDDMSVVSFGDPFPANFMAPKMTIVVQNPAHVGEQAAKLLLRKLDKATESDDAEEVILPTHVRLGESVRNLIRK